jgi:hypothetical protein
VDTAEKLQVGHYPIGGLFLPHNDNLYIVETNFSDALRAHGDRIATMLFYVSAQIIGMRTQAILGQQALGHQKSIFELGTFFFHCFSSTMSLTVAVLHLLSWANNTTQREAPQYSGKG